MGTVNRDPGRQPSRAQREEATTAPDGGSPAPDGDGASRLTAYVTRQSSRGRTAEAVTAVLREAILDGVLEPSTWLREEELAKELAVSRTPIREALGRLSADGLVTITARQGAIVTPLSLEDVLDLFDVRERLEGLAARLAARHRSEPELQELERILARMDGAGAEQRLADLLALNVAFHRLIRQAARNRFLDRFLAQAEQAYRPSGRATYEVPGRIAAVIAEHRRIFAAIAAGDADDAERRAIEHLQRTRELRIRMLTEGYAKPTSGRRE